MDGRDELGTVLSFPNSALNPSPSKACFMTLFLSPPLFLSLSNSLLLLCPLCVSPTPLRTLLHLFRPYLTMASQPTKDPESIYGFTVKDAKGNDVHLSTYKGKVLLIVNVASKCGMTNSNYSELNQLYEKFKDQGLEILAFPCNQFGEEEPGSNDQISEFVCTRFKSEFPIFEKIEVNGENAAPLYKFLKLGKWGIFGDDIQWNFAKFLVDKDGHVVDRYYPTTSPLSIEHDVKKLLGVL